MSTPEPGPEQQGHAAPPPTYYPPAYGHPPPYGYPYAPRPTNGMAIAAMVLGIVGVCNPVGVLGLIFGLVAKRQIRERGDQGDGFAVTGIVLGWIGVASLIFWILYIVVVITAIGTVVDDVDNLPTDAPSSESAAFLLLWPR